MNRKHISVIIALLMTVAFTAEAQTFRQTMSSMLSNDYPHFQWLEYPVDNYGIATAYRGTKDNIDRRSFLCATFTCLGLDQPASDSDSGKWMAAGGYADLGCGGSLDNKLTKKRDLVVNAVLPKLLSVVGISADVQRNQQSTVDLKGGSLCARQLVQGKMLNYINGLKEADSTFYLKTALDHKQLVLVVGDIVIKSLTLNIHATPSFKAQIDTKLQGKTTQIFGDQATIGVKVERSSDKEYSLAITHPVIAGILAVRQQPDTKSVGQVLDTKWSDWAPATIPTQPAAR